MSTLKHGDLVWAKLKGFSPWPARISHAPPDLKASKSENKYLYVYFFGRNSYDFVKRDDIKPYEENKEKMMRYCITESFKIAINLIEQYIEDADIFPDIDRGFSDTKENIDIFTTNGIKEEPPDSLPEIHEESKPFLPAPEIQVLLDRVDIYECMRCPACFLNHDEYKAHLWLHDQENEISINKICYKKNYKCNHCDAEFVLQRTLKAHSVLHQPFPHNCECGIGYFRLVDFNMHKKLIHPPSEPPEPQKQMWKPKITKHKNNDNMIPVKKQSRVKRCIYARTRKNATIDSPFKCPVCNKALSSKAAVEIHSITHTGKKPFKCNICGNRFTQKGNLNLHHLRHIGDKRFLCSYCNKGFYDRSALKLHERTHTGVKPYECQYCKKDFADPSAFNRHIRTHTGHKPYQCPLCPKNFSDASALIQHKKRHGQKEIECKICKKKFYNRHALSIHLSVHSGSKKFECNECGKKFSLKRYLVIHIRSHLTDKKYKCDYCGASYKFKARISEHILRKHLKLKKHKCDECGLRLCTKRQLYFHKRTLHAVRIYCYKCRRFFFTETALNRHKEICNAPYCNMCDQYFVKKDSFVKHMKQKHDDKTVLIELTPICH